MSVINILILEDSRSDLELLKLELDSMDHIFNIENTHNELVYRRLLVQFNPDIIISDYEMPEFDGLKALGILREKNVKTPFIFLTGTVGEEHAVRAIKAGATDFIVKRNMHQIPSAILKALREFREANSKEIYFKRLVESENRFKAMVEQSAELVCILELNGNFKYISENYHAVFGETIDFYSESIFNFIHRDDLEQFKLGFQEALKQRSITLPPYRFKNAFDKHIWLQSTLTNFTKEPAIEGIVINSQDVSKLVKKDEELRVSLQRFQFAAKASHDAIYEWDFTEEKLQWAEGFNSLFGYEILENNIKAWKRKIFHLDRKRILKAFEKAIKTPNTEFWSNDYRLYKQDNSIAYVEDKAYIIRDKEGKAIKMIGSLADLTDKITFQQKLLESTIQSREKEASRISRELHDGIIQELTACSLMLGNMQKKNDIKDLHAQLARIDEQMKKTIRETRNLSHNLISADVQNESFERLLDRLLNNLNRASQVKFEAVLSTSEDLNLNNEIKINLFRVIQELTTNILKHSKADRAEILIENQQQLLKLKIADNGIGFKNRDAIQGIGLSNVRQRIEILGGTIAFQNSIKGGALVIINIPI